MVHIKGRARTAYTHRLSGLAICAECGSFMATRVDGNYRGLCCPASKGRPTLPKCNHRRTVSERKIIARINEFLVQMLEEQTTEIFNGNSSSNVPDIQARIVLLTDEIADLEDKVRLLIRKQMMAGKDIQDIYEEELEKLNQQLGNMKEARIRLKGESLAVSTSTSNQQATLEELAELTLERFWHQESREINQMLHRVMGNRRLVILNGEVIGVAKVNRNQRRRK